MMRIDDKNDKKVIMVRTIVLNKKENFLINTLKKCCVIISLI